MWGTSKHLATSWCSHPVIAWGISNAVLVRKCYRFIVQPLPNSNPSPIPPNPDTNHNKSTGHGIPDEGRREDVARATSKIPNDPTLVQERRPIRQETAVPSPVREMSTDLQRRRRSCTTATNNPPPPNQRTTEWALRTPNSAQHGDAVDPTDQGYTLPREERTEPSSPITGSHEEPGQAPTTNTPPPHLHPDAANLRTALRKNTRANIKVATLNLRGAAGQTTSRKWRDLNECFKRRAIGVAAVQETHNIEVDELRKINQTPGYCIHIIHSGDPEKPNSAGIAIVLNKYLTRWQEATAKVIIPGRAIHVTLPWLENSTLHLLVVYAPNEPGKNASFWKKIREEWRTRTLPKPDVLLGDFNLTENPLDREPTSLSMSGANSELFRLKADLVVVDAWRLDFPNKKEYTWERLPDCKSKSRIDRIYLSHELHPFAFEWDMSYTEVRTDHRMVSVRLSKASAPAMGKGRWCIPPSLLKDKSIIHHINTTGIELNREITALAQAQNNENEDENVEKKPETYIQTLFQKWKEKILEYTRKIAKTKMPRIDA